MSFKLVWLAVLCSFTLLGHFVQSATLNGNGYTLTIAISEDSISSVSNSTTFLASLRETVSKASRALFEATDSKVYFQTVDILLPGKWALNVTGAVPSWRVNYLNADIRVEDTFDNNDDLILTPRTHHTKPCGYSGEYIILPAQFFDDPELITGKFGDLTNVFLHEWAHYRYGVFEEYGYPKISDEDPTRFPYSFVNTRGEQQITSCNNTEIKGNFSKTWDGVDCSLEEDFNCRFYPDLNDQSGPTSSLMSMQFLPTVKQFCDSSNHDPTAPTPHNFWCRNRSVKTVMERHPDFRSLVVSNITNTEPKFNYLLPAPQAVYFLLDVSNHESYPSTWFNVSKQKLDAFFSRLASARPSTPVSILTMGGDHVDTSSTLGGYVRTVVGPTALSSSTLTTVRTPLSKLEPNETGLRLVRALMDAADLSTPFSQLSSSIVFVLKLSSATDVTAAPIESQVANLLNSRNVRLVTVENDIDPAKSNLRRLSSDPLTDSSYFPATTSLESTLDQAFDEIINLTESQNRFRSRRVQVGWDEITVEAEKNVSGTYAVDVVKSEVYVTIHVPKQVSSENLEFKMFNTRGVEMISGGLATLTKAGSSWNAGLNNIYTIYIPSTSTASLGQYRYEVAYNGTDSVSGYVDALEILPDTTDVSIGGGGFQTARPYNMEVYTSADASTGNLNLGQSGEEQALLVYTSISKGFGLARTTSVTATVHTPDGGSSRLFLRDDGIYPDMKIDDGVYTGQMRPTLNGRYRVSVDVYRRVPNVPLVSESSQPFSSAMPIDQALSNFYCDSDCGANVLNRNFRRVVPYATQLTIEGSQGYVPRPRRILDLKLVDIDPDSTTANLSWTSPLNSYWNGSVNSYRLVYGYDVSNLVTANGLISSAAIEVSPSDVVSGSLTPTTPGSPQTVTITLTGDNTCRALFFTIASSNIRTGSATIESYPAPVVFAPCNCTECIVPSTTLSPTTASTQSSTSTQPSTSTPSKSTATSTARSTSAASTSTSTSATTATTAAIKTTSGAGSVGMNLIFLLLVVVAAWL